MANNEETQMTDIIFRGIDGNECEAFVVAIRDLAFANGKDKDPDWMVRYATTRLRGKALRWHAELDPSTRKDWDLFVQAMFKEYPFVQERDDGGIATPVWTSTTYSPAPSNPTLPSNVHQITTPSNLPPMGAEGVSVGRSQSTDPTPLVEHVTLPRAYDPSLPGVHTGRLLIIYEEGRQGHHYISASSKRATRNIHEALIVSFIPSAEPHQLACFNCGEPKLGVRLSPPNISKIHPLVGSHYHDGQVAVHYSSHQDIASIWNISTDGTLRAKLPKDLVKNPNDGSFYIPSEYCSTTAAYVDLSGATVWFVKDDGTVPATDPLSGLPILRARIVFEPI